MDDSRGASTSAVGTSSLAAPRLSLQVPSASEPVEREVGPSLTNVEQSCLMTLNNLLSQNSSEWHPIVPARRHSFPAKSPTNANFSSLLGPQGSSSALQTLVENLRNRYSTQDYESSDLDDTSLLSELESRVTMLIEDGSIRPRDAPLARSLVSLLHHIKRLTVLSPKSTHRSPVDFQQPLSTAEIYDTLSQRVSELQSHRDANRSDSTSQRKRPPIEAVEHAILWHKVDDDLDQVLQLCRERSEPVPYSPAEGSLPPEYEYDDTELPMYDPAEYLELAATKSAGKSTKVIPPANYVSTSLDEKMRLDLEAITLAIDRLYLVAPQLSNQRVELKRSKLDQMERARLNGSVKGKAKEGPERDLRELDRMLELISKASARRYDDQSVVLDGERGMADRLEKARLRDLQKRNAFQERLLDHSGAGRLTSQDAEPRKSTSSASLQRNPEALVTLPEFLRESFDVDVEYRDPNALLTLPEFVQELQAASPPQPPAPASLNYTPKFMRRSFISSRSRSLSAPPLAWLLPNSLSGNKSSPTSNSSETSSPSSRAGLEVHYVAEHQANLSSVAVFLQVNGVQAGTDVEAEVFSSGSDRLIVKSGSSTSAPLSLPARVTPGKKPVKVQSGHFEMKLECLAGQSMNGGPVQYDADTPGTGLLDATQIRTMNPTTFICASCSLPVVHAYKVKKYDDLPSEHWAELVEAWMCHSDQQLNDRIALYAKGLWPMPTQALVGGSYILFDKSVLATSNIKSVERPEIEQGDDWQQARCICGAVIGRSMEHDSHKGTRSITYRLAKYALRPVSPSSEPLTIPLSAYILQDMDELVQAHATYRFVLLDEEEEKPRILIWLFKPHIRISYANSNHKLLARYSSMHAAKVHFKILGPSVSPTIKSTIEKYPIFANSERLVYPMEICRRLANLLKESNIAYPQGMRIMGGLDVGWLLRI
ncbi:hypothetical protein M422DRAFT_77237 [Sphaerobolus stellatus SS14]|uniref:Uncharacterized protein n=1 Tax=Sphaerobolus stellatus (strain SS14) TaxID=990650 RepID=A0A0C9U2X2_SPHS4|nr:hypothetical protein M422DRAFT_77237 [Sphaerobolus stellatus SS14]